MITFSRKGRGNVRSMINQNRCNSYVLSRMLEGTSQEIRTDGQEVVAAYDEAKDRAYRAVEEYTAKKAGGAEQVSCFLESKTLTEALRSTSVARAQKRFTLKRTAGVAFGSTASLITVSNMRGVKKTVYSHSHDSCGLCGSLSSSSTP